MQVGFQKTAHVRGLGWLEHNHSGLAPLRLPGRPSLPGRRAQRSHSYYLDGARRLEIRDLLEKVAEAYAVSPDPADYLFEAIRANTTNVPNENHDAFHQTELTRFDTALGMPVYMTYAGKPHHINHKAENPKAARGVVIDAHYHDEQPPLDNCPRCSTKTSLRQNRDETGIHCRKCGHVVTDEFVEILVGVDARKDPAFARGVRTGQLNAGSMGCNCLNTVCNVCNHVAYSRPEFCEHIRAGNKGSLWIEQHGRWVKSDAMQVRREAERRGYVWAPTDFCYLETPDGFRCRKSFENCQRVVFDEYSRVDQPADPKALSREILKAARVAVPDSVAGIYAPGHIPTTDELATETSWLLRSVEAKRGAMARAARAHTKTAAQQFFVVRVNGDESDIHAAGTLEEAIAQAAVSNDDRLEMCTVSAEAADQACGMFNDSTAQPISKEGDVVIQAPPDEPVVVEPQAPSPQVDQTAPPPQTIEDYQNQEMGLDAPPGPEEQLSLDEIGVMPPGAEAPRRAVGSIPMKFAESYRDWVAEVSPAGNTRILTADKTPILIIRGQAETSEKARRERGKQIMAHLLRHGLVATAQKMHGIVTPKVGQVVDHAIDDMKEFADKYIYESVQSNGVDDMQGDARQGKPPTYVVQDEDDDMRSDVRGTPPKDSTGGGGVDHAEGKPESTTSPVSETNTDMRDDGRKTFKMTDSALDNEIHDHAERLAALVGKRVAHKSQPRAPWLVRQIAASVTQEEARQWGSVSVILARQSHEGKIQQRRIKAQDFLQTWHVADKHDDKDEEDERKHDICKETENDDHTEKMARLERRLRKTHAAQIAKLKKEQQKALELHRQGAVQSFCRALRLADARQASDLEASPLKQAAQQLLATPRPVGVDSATQQPIEYQGMAPEMAQYLVAELYQRGHAPHLENLLNRAAALMEMDDQYLVDAEQDARNFRRALPAITAQVHAHPIDQAAMRAAQMRQAAVHGNFTFNSTPPPEGFALVAGSSEAPMGKRGAIRNAVQGTLVDATLGHMRQLN